MKHLRFLPVLAMLCSACGSIAQPPASIFPEPVSTQWGQGQFYLNTNTVIVAAAADKPSVQFFNDYLKKLYGLQLTVVSQSPANNFIALENQEVSDLKFPSEHYRLEATPDHIQITAPSGPGIFYGIQTLIQLLPLSPFTATPTGYAIRPTATLASANPANTKTASFSIPSVTIDDYPRFAYRGLHLDCGRHFFSVEFVKRYIDFIALHKMNYFHWHLTEDQGWRIEIKKYPRLTEVGSCRSGTIIGHAPGTGDDSTQYCGYYTQDQIKDIVKYAADRYITVIPEIELPGHSSAALTAYPYLGCTGGPYHVQHGFGVFKDVFCAGNDSVFQFLDDVMDEVIQLFPAKYIHIGGDECPKDSWKTCPKCQKRIHDLGLKDEEALQSYFVQRVEKYINSKGKQIIGWDEILEGGIAPNATIMSWRGEKGGIQAAQQHHNVIMTPGQYVYLDHAQIRNDDSLTIGGYLPLKQVYSYEPVPKELAADEQQYVLGAQANVWSEYMSNPRKVEYMLFPRLTALSEVLWSPKAARNWDDFNTRLPAQYKRYALWGVNAYQAYIPPKDSLVRTNLQKWQDAKFGLLMHWGTYSQWGIVESWSICPEDEGWTQRRGPYAANYNDYLKAYTHLQTTFNPTHFNPARWAAAAKTAGMKYVVFTTKHHDGFCMFDTKQTDYKITSPNCPFAKNPKSNVTKAIFDAFRADGLMTGAYFSKPDWHSTDYWWPYFPPKDRNVNYDPAKYPDRWKAFAKYTYNQIEELMTGYGKMDVLWLDGGWVRPLSTVDPAIDWERNIPYDQDVDMPAIAKMARSHQPGLIIVDRSVPGEFENYRTPEQTVPSHPVDDPWESCITMGNSWSYVPHDHYKSATELIQLLIKIVSRGGNLLLNIGPSPDGDWDDTAYARLKEIGAWLNTNGEAIYGTHPIRPYASGPIFLTQSKDSLSTFAFYLGDPTNPTNSTNSTNPTNPANPDITLPTEITIDRFTPTANSKVTILGFNPTTPLTWREDNHKMIITIPPSLLNKPIGQHAIAFKIAA